MHFVFLYQKRNIVTSILKFKTWMYAPVVRMLYISMYGFQICTRTWKCQHHVT